MNQEIDWLLQEKYQGVKSADFEADCARLATGVPLGYLIGHVPFLDCTIHLDSHPLIPRVETEYWVEKAIAVIKQPTPVTPNLRGRTPTILDLCAGSGAIGVAVARELPDALVTFSELDPSHLSTIKKNLTYNLPNQTSATDGRYEIIASDLFAQVRAGQTFDFILSNPPYIDTAAHTVALSVTNHEPHLALFCGLAGMEIITRIITQLSTCLNPEGQLWLEHEPTQAVAIATLATVHGLTCLTHPDQYGTPRFSVLSVAQ
jgi:release factor glutamine methyltransferase